MNRLSNDINELDVAAAFTQQSKVFDQLYTGNIIIEYKRKRFREHILSYAKKNASMLELNCGTGDDAIFFSQRGFTIHATDISKGMLDVLGKKLGTNQNKDSITVEQCSFTDLNSLQFKGPFDYIYSNFGGLNCTPDLEKVLHSLGSLVKPGGVITLVIISKFCLWEILLMFKGKFKTAFRRFFATKGRKANVEERAFKCWYYSPSFVKKSMKDQFEFLSLEGLCSIVPPSYIEDFAKKYQKSFRLLANKENRLKSHWPWNQMGDYFIISFRRKNQARST